MTFSETKQQFKIGRMTYSLPTYIHFEDSVFFLHFQCSIGGIWHATYRRGIEHLLECHEPTFNKALKALHKKVKEHETGTN